MSKPCLGAWASVLLLTACSLGCGGSPPAAPKDADAIDRPRLQSFGTLPEVVPAATGAASQDLIDLGRMLYYEPRLSKSHQISCNSCHDLARYGVDNQPTSDGHNGQLGTRNSPSVYNAAGHFAQFWDGRARDVEAQAKGPVTNPIEMAMPSEHVVVATLESMPEYVAAFRRAFPGQAKPVTYDNMAVAIGAFERKLLTPARWDALLRGDDSALSAEERAGLRIFVEAGCSACHSGALLGGNSFQRLGASKPYPRTEDAGRYHVTSQDADRFVFKVPSLRNVEKTAPYFHDGRVATLEAAVREMAEYQLGRTFTEPELGRIVAFLRALTGRMPLEYIKEPALPKSTARTPRPDLR